MDVNDLPQLQVRTQAIAPGGATAPSPTGQQTPVMQSNIDPGGGMLPQPTMHPLADFIQGPPGESPPLQPQHHQAIVDHMNTVAQPAPGSYESEKAKFIAGTRGMTFNQMERMQQGYQILSAQDLILRDKRNALDNSVRARLEQIAPGISSVNSQTPEGQQFYSKLTPAQNASIGKVHDWRLDTMEKFNAPAMIRDAPGGQ